MASPAATGAARRSTSTCSTGAPPAGVSAQVENLKLVPGKACRRGAANVQRHGIARPTAIAALPYCLNEPALRCEGYTPTLRVRVRAGSKLMDSLAASAGLGHLTSSAIAFSWRKSRCMCSIWVVHAAAHIDLVLVLQRRIDVGLQDARQAGVGPCKRALRASGDLVVPWWQPVAHMLRIMSHSHAICFADEGCTLGAGLAQGRPRLRKVSRTTAGKILFTTESQAQGCATTEGLLSVVA